MNIVLGPAPSHVNFYGPLPVAGQ